jgi:hypothetical protein
MSESLRPARNLGHEGDFLNHTFDQGDQRVRPRVPCQEAQRGVRSYLEITAM